MIKINKHLNNQPQSWAKFSKTFGASYAPNEDLRNALLAEQGYICAFCMRRIPLSKRDPIEKEYSKIAHLKSRKNHPDLQLGYENLVACCPGNIDGTPHCDKSQASENVELPIFETILQASIKYATGSGQIQSSNVAWNNAINLTLCLNNPTLKKNRYEALRGVESLLFKRKWKKAELEKTLDKWRNFDGEGKLKEYCGIIIWYLEKKLHQL